jgi:DMSO/TMAO reductase YedYZ molybdopterin-dependent catalytic subunit
MAEERRIVTAEPENSETPLEGAGSWVTPNRLFFVRNHFHVPAVDLVTWRLRVGGCVERPHDWSMEELASLPERTVFATMECAGNGRSFLSPHVHGVQWGAGAIGHAEWSGVPLRSVLEQLGIRPETKEILFEGLDTGREADHPETLTFARSLPMTKALDRDTLLVTKMNGELLEPAHGFPLRLLVPGWYGVASVKWLTRIEALDHPFGGYYQTKKYTLQRRTRQGAVETTVVGPIAVKSEMIRPRAGETLGVGTNRLFGVAWAGQETIARVEVSADAGKSWGEAELLGPLAPYSWTTWEYLWEVGKPGRYILLVRATSAGGRIQPLSHDPLLGGYQIHFARPREVEIVAQKRSQDRHADVDALVYDMNAFAEENTRRTLDVDLEVCEGAGI